MPLYEYLCTSCGHRFERIQKFSDPQVAICPQCGGPVEKQVSSPAIQFKGAGWYVTDYAKSAKSDNSSTKPAKSEDASKAGESAKSESAKSETAPAVAKPASTDKT